MENITSQSSWTKALMAAITAAWARFTSYSLIIIYFPVYLWEHWMASILTHFSDTVLETDLQSPGSPTTTTKKPSPNYFPLIYTEAVYLMKLFFVLLLFRLHRKQHFWFSLVIFIFFFFFFWKRSKTTSEMIAWEETRDAWQCWMMMTVMIWQIRNTPARLMGSFFSWISPTEDL